MTDGQMFREACAPGCWPLSRSPSRSAPAISGISTLTVLLLPMCSRSQTGRPRPSSNAQAVAGFDEAAGAGHSARLVG